MDNADPRSSEIDVTFVQMIAVDDQPFSVVENPGLIIKKTLVAAVPKVENLGRGDAEMGDQNSNRAAKTITQIATTVT
uniref:Uncharacterized protein n=1 Tax=Romanomermis culicivorax TaxID=13658 RepID=A0A915L1X3_ROMCU